MIILNRALVTFGIGLQLLWASPSPAADKEARYPYPKSYYTYLKVSNEKEGQFLEGDIRKICFGQIKQISRDIDCRDSYRHRYQGKTFNAEALDQCRRRLTYPENTPGPRAECLKMIVDKDFDDISLEHCRRLNTYNKEKTCLAELADKIIDTDCVPKLWTPGRNLAVQPLLNCSVEHPKKIAVGVKTCVDYQSAKARLTETLSKAKFAKHRDAIRATTEKLDGEFASCADPGNPSAGAGAGAAKNSPGSR